MILHVNRVCLLYTYTDDFTNPNPGIPDPIVSHVVVSPAVAKGPNPPMRKSPAAGETQLTCPNLPGVFQA